MMGGRVATALDQRCLPILEAVQRYYGVHRIHMPGHKGGPGASDPCRALFGPGVYQADLVGIEELDDFHSPTGCIAEAQALAAQAWGADHSFFLVNGTSCGLQALILALCGPGDELIIPRTVHRSVVGGLILSGAVPVYLDPEVEPIFGLALGVTPESVDAALRAHPGARGVLIVSPTYYGVTSNVRAIAEVAHRHGVPLLVDEAHGAHLGFGPDVPASSIQQGADGAAQGVHKTAGSLSQASILHLKGDRVPVSRVRHFLRLLQTTSPSYLLLTSLDGARWMLANEGPRRLAAVVGFAQRIREAVESWGASGAGLRWLHLDPATGPFGTDPTRLTINVRQTGLTGYYVERTLRWEFGVQIELSDLGNIVLLLSVGDTPEVIEAFIASFGRIVREAPERRVAGGGGGGNGGSGPGPSGLAGTLPPAPPMVLSPATASNRATTRVDLDRACGLVSGEMIAVYPPGIPVIYPGERITPEVAGYLRQAVAAGLRVQGAEDARLETIRVIDG